MRLELSRNFFKWEGDAPGELTGLQVKKGSDPLDELMGTQIDKKKKIQYIKTLERIMLKEFGKIITFYKFIYILLIKL